MQPSPIIDAQLDAIRMTPSARAEAQHALELGVHTAELILAIKGGLKWLFQVPVRRRAARAAPAAERSGEVAKAGDGTALRSRPQAAN
jgi:hypothetical protein